jgi:uncharacterized membrane protein YcaP (DUF421 family)
MLMELMLATLGKGIVTVGLVILLTRLNGLRSFAKFSSFDFAVTIATGSVMATAITANDRFLAGLATLLVLFLIQGTISRLRTRSDALKQAVDNTPLLLVKDGEFLHDNMKEAQISPSDVVGKLREMNACERGKLRAVVLETTGNISVIYAEPDAEMVEGLFDNVRGEARHVL